MAFSARILALIQKIEAADAEHFARLRERTKKEADAVVSRLMWKIGNGVLPAPERDRG
jgi:hypothetical protein